MSSPDMAASRRKPDPAESDNAPAPSARIAVWLEANQTHLAQAIAQLAGVTIVGAGSPTRGHSGAVASELACPAHDDLRALLTATDADAVLLLTPGELSTRDNAAYSAAM